MLACGTLPLTYTFAIEIDLVKLDPKYPKDPKTFGERIRKARMDRHIIPPPVGYGGAEWGSETANSAAVGRTCSVLTSTGPRLFQEQVRVR